MIENISRAIMIPIEISQVTETAGKQGRADVMEAMRKFRAYEGETEGRPIIAKTEGRPMIANIFILCFFKLHGCRKAQGAQGHLEARGRDQLLEHNNLPTS